MEINLGLGSYQLAARSLSSQRMVNAYIEPAPPGAKSKASVSQCFGIKDFLTVGSDFCRGGTVVNNTVYVVVGTGLYSLTVDGLTNYLGLIPGSGRVFVQGDGTNIMVTCNGPSYVYTGGVVKQITDPAFPGAQWVTFLDGYMVVGPGDGRVYVNQTPYQPASWNALNFASAEASPDDVVVGVVDHRELALFNRETTEFWYDSGAVNFPLTRTASGFMEKGTSSKYGPVKSNNSIYFPGHDGPIYRVDGYTPVRISTYTVEQAIASYTDKTCVGLSWLEGGHAMVGFSYPAGTWVYDISTSIWHERASYGYANWRIIGVLRANNQTYVLDGQSNRIGILDPGTFAEWDKPLVSQITSAAIANNNEFIQHAKLELVFEQGVGTLGGNDPQVMLQYSNDGGRTWSSEIWRGLGKLGDYRRQVIFNRLGQAQDRVYRLSASDSVRRTLIQALLNEQD